MRGRRPCRDPHMTDMKHRMPTGTGRLCDAAPSSRESVLGNDFLNFPRNLFRRLHSPLHDLNPSTTPDKRDRGSASGLRPHHSLLSAAAAVFLPVMGERRRRKRKEPGKPFPCALTGTRETKGKRGSLRLWKRPCCRRCVKIVCSVS